MTTTHINRAQACTDRALAKLDAGFTAKARQKEANDQLNRAYNELQQLIHAAACDLANKVDPNRENQEAWSSKVNEYDMPFDLHHVRERHITKTRELVGDDVADRIAFLIETRAAVKAEPIQKVEPKAPSAYQVKAEKSIMELIEKRESQYLEAIDLGRIFEGLPVSANSHWVVNQYGTGFVRTFYYLSGKLTPLNVIIAAAQTLAREAEGK